MTRRITPKNALRADVGQRLASAPERDEQGRVWCQLFPTGEWHRSDFPGGKLELQSDLFATFIASWESAGSPALPIDYHHEEDEPAAGWIEGLRVGASGGLEGAVRWTERAASHIKADEYRFLSPTWTMSHVSRRTGKPAGPWLYGAALLNDPFYDSMPRVAASAEAESTHNPNKEQDMSFLKKMAAAFGLAEDSSEEQVEAACTAALKSKAALGETEGKLTAAAGESVKLMARIGELEAQTAKHAAEMFDRDFEVVFEAGLTAGHGGLPGMKDTLKATAKALGLEPVKALIAGMSKLPLAAVGTPGTDADSTKDLATKATDELNAYVDERVKAGVKYVDAMREANRVKRDVVERAFTVVTTSTKPPVEG